MILRCTVFIAILANLVAAPPDPPPDSPPDSPADSPPAAAPRPAGGPIANHDPHAQLQRILQQPIYQRWRLRELRGERSAVSNGAEDDRLRALVRYVRRALRTVVRWIGDVLRSLFGGWQGPAWSGGGGTSAFVSALRVGAWIALGAALVFMAIVIYRAVQNRRRAPQSARVLSREQVRQALEDGQALAMNAPRWLQEAGRLAGEGDFRVAYRAMYLAMLSHLHGAGKIDFRKNRTNWSYVSRFKGSDEQRRLFRGLTALFDDVWYGLKPPRGVNIDTVKAQVAQLMNHA